MAFGAKFESSKIAWLVAALLLAGGFALGLTVGGLSWLAWSTTGKALASVAPTPTLLPFPAAVADEQAVSK